MAALNLFSSVKFSRRSRRCLRRVPMKAKNAYCLSLSNSPIVDQMDFIECGVIHTDLKSTNILMELETPSDTVSKYLEFVPPRTTRGQSGAIIPLREVIKTLLVSEVASLRVRIIDFGVSSWREKHLSDELQPLSLSAPEVTIGATWDTGVDIWSLGCLVVQFVQGIVLFSGEASKRGTWSAEDEHLAKIVEVLGPFPSSLLKKGRRSAKYFDEQGNLIRIPNLEPTSLERMLNGEAMPFIKHPDMPDSEMAAFVDFVQGMLQIDPMARKSAAQLPSGGPSGGYTWGLGICLLSHHTCSIYCHVGLVDPSPNSTSI
ncbi:hypothetical protein E4U09_006654 [Claviceps aff. purpurea]|uniref:non-specific serine/threonine protein kinase n=1 Tax=Claviceps aff. purpurea TaxID=1967640 RepID=A0A9P7QKR0_9HYPO|nr:hypothetical protein E4U09_006654 [Claviceps aff. purpurea]